jgi:hypothetical protein
LQPLDVNQETLREARSQKRKATSPTPQEEVLDQEIRDLEAIRARQKTRNPKPEPGIPEPEPEIPETRILFGNFG